MTKNLRRNTFSTHRCIAYGSLRVMWGWRRRMYRCGRFTSQPKPRWWFVPVAPPGSDWEPLCLIWWRSDNKQVSTLTTFIANHFQWRPIGRTITDLLRLLLCSQRPESHAPWFEAKLKAVQSEWKAESSLAGLRHMDSRKAWHRYS